MKRSMVSEIWVRLPKKLQNQKKQEKKQCFYEKGIDHGNLNGLIYKGIDRQKWFRNMGSSSKKNYRIRRKVIK